MSSTRNGCASAAGGEGQEVSARAAPAARARDALRFIIDDPGEDSNSFVFESWPKRVPAVEIKGAPELARLRSDDSNPVFGSSSSASGRDCVSMSRIPF